MKLDEITKKTGIICNDNHTYIRESDGKQYLGCTSVLEMIPKKFSIASKYGANVAVDLISKEWNDSLVWTSEKRKELLDRAKLEPKRKSDEALDTGTLIHNWIEQHIRGKDIPKPSGYEDFINEFLEWEYLNVEEWIGCEMLVASHELGIAGRLDAVALLKSGLTAIVDFKTSNTIYPAYYLQTSIYWTCLKEMGFGADQRIILRIPKEKIRKVYNKKTRRYYKEEDHIESEIVMTDINEDIEIVKHLKSIYPWVKQYE